MKIFAFLLALLIPSAWAQNYGMKFGPTSTDYADDFIAVAGGVYESYQYLAPPSTSSKLIYKGYRLVENVPYVIGYTPQCNIADSPQSCGFHTYKLSPVTGTWISETDVTGQSLQWNMAAGTIGGIHQLDVGLEVNWSPSDDTSDYYDTVWIIDSNGVLYNMRTANPPWNQNSCATQTTPGGHTMPDPNYSCEYGPAHAVTLSAVTSNGVKYVSSGGANGQSGPIYCNVAIIADGNVWWGGQAFSGTDGTAICNWVRTTADGNIISVANADLYIYAIDSNYNIKSFSILDTPPSSWNEWTVINGWRATADNPVFVDAVNSSFVFFVGSSGAMYSYSNGYFSEPIPFGNSGTASVYIAPDNIAYLSVGPDAVYVGDSQWAVTGNNWRIPHVSCPAGYYVSTTCTLCSSGKYSGAGIGTYTSTRSCTDCPANTYFPVTGATSLGACLTCPAHSSSPMGASSCQCDTNYYSYPTCTYCLASTTCSGHGSCNLDASCACNTGYAGTTCNTCDVGYSGYPNCVQPQSCNPATTCSGHGSCNLDGTCACNTGFSGASCNQCDVNYYSYPSCTYCLASTTCAGFGSCSPVGACVCQAGYYYTGSTCAPCATNQYSNAGSSACNNCNAGSVPTPDHSTCMLCSAGTIASQPGDSVCTACAPGSVAGSAGATACTQCGAGSASDVNSAYCVPCTAGSYSASSASTTCTACSAGSYQDLTSQTACLACSPGSYTTYVAQTTCVTCPTGYYQSTSGQTTCVACPAGTSVSVDQSQCLTCVTGKYAPSIAETVCQYCPAGSYANSNATACLLCSPGTFKSDQTQVSCTPCPNGFYVPFSGATVCLACTAGNYSNSVTGFDICSECLPGTYSASNGASACTACTGPGNYSSGLESTACSLCDTNAVAVNANSACPAMLATGVMEYHHAPPAQQVLTILARELPPTLHAHPVVPDTIHQQLVRLTFLLVYRAHPDTLQRLLLLHAHYVKTIHFPRNQVHQLAPVVIAMEHRSTATLRANVTQDSTCRLSILLPVFPALPEHTRHHLTLTRHVFHALLEHSHPALLQHHVLPVLLLAILDPVLQPARLARLLVLLRPVMVPPYVVTVCPAR